MCVPEVSWKKLYTAPRLRGHYGLTDRVNAQDAYRQQRSIERFRARPDAYMPEQAGKLMQGEIGQINGIRIVTDNYRNSE